MLPRHANMSKMMVSHTILSRTYTVIEDYDQERNMYNATERTFANATPMEHIMTKHNHPETHPLVQDKSFDVKDPSGNDIFRFHTPQMKRSGFCSSTSHQKLIVRSADDSAKIGEVRENKFLCCPPDYTIHEVSPITRTLNLKYKLRARSCGSIFHCCFSSFPAYDIFDRDDGKYAIGKVDGNNIEFPVDASKESKMCIIGGEILINANYL